MMLEKLVNGKVLNTCTAAAVVFLAELCYCLSPQILKLGLQRGDWRNQPAGMSSDGGRREYPGQNRGLCFENA